MGPDIQQSSKRPWLDALDSLDVSRASMFSKDMWRTYFKRLREDSPIHFHKDSAFGPSWSVTTFDHIMAMDRSNQQFSSASGITLVDAEMSRAPR